MMHFTDVGANFVHSKADVARSIAEGAITPSIDIRRYSMCFRRHVDLGILCVARMRFSRNIAEDREV